MATLVRQITQCCKFRAHSWRNSFCTLGSLEKSTMGSLQNPCVDQNGLLRSSGLTTIPNSTTQLGMIRLLQTQSHSKVVSLEDQNKALHQFEGNNNSEGLFQKIQIGENVSRKDKISFLIGTLLDIKDSKEAVYGTLDAWVAWEQNFPIGPLKRVLQTLEAEQQWHRVIQVLKWMLSKGQGNTMGTYGQLIRALDMDHRAEEAHEVWVKKIGNDLHAVPWQLCKLMISVYYRNNMLENIVKLFKGLEAFDRKPPEKSIVKKVANAYEMLGSLEERDRVLEKYKGLFSEAGCPKKKSRNLSKKKKKNKGRENRPPSSSDVDSIQQKQS